MAYKIIHNPDFPQHELDALGNGIEEFTARQVGPSDRQDLILMAYDEEGTLIGGLEGNTEKGWFYISALWVAESARGSGLGSALMHEAEIIAIERGCKNMYLDTLSVQAPGFYQKLGFTRFAELEDFPGEVSKIFFRKRLV
jgi:ribosomal protein S18 acetylase RimI-like enzyme